MKIQKIILLIALVAIFSIKLIHRTEAMNIDSDVEIQYSSLKILDDDTLIKISSEIYFSENYSNYKKWNNSREYMEEIVRMNNIKNKDLIHAGKYIIFPYVVKE